jgi:GRAS domain family
LPDLKHNEEVLKKALEQTAVCWKQFPHLTDADFIADFIQCLHWRYEGHPSEEAMNTYLKEFEIPQAFLFDILANRFPLVLSSQTLLISTICTAAAGHKEITLIDLGCGRGEQLVRILHALNEVPELRTVTVIGTEILGSSLEFCASYVASVNHRFRFTLQFHGLPGPVENMTRESIEALIPEQSDALLINASLLMHHVQQVEKRRSIFELLYSLQPVLLTLVEPDTDCFTDDTDQRILNAYEHFGSLYTYISTLPVSATERKGLKQFFRNELYDTLVLDDTHRFEKYIRGEEWISLATEAGFVIKSVSGLATLTEVPGVKIEERTAGYVSFSFQGSDILSVIGLG